MKRVKKIIIYLAVFLLINLISIGVLYENAYKVSWALFIGIAIILLLTTAVLIIQLIILVVRRLTNRDLTNSKRGLLSSVITFFFVIFLGATQIIVSEFHTYSPDNGGISSIEQVEINDSSQYISIRTQNENNPVILFLAGGPGGTQMSATREFLTDLEDDFTIVNWDQPGTGKSYDAAYRFDTLTTERYLNDAHELTSQLKQRFNQDKIYLIGESWGSYLAVMLSKTFPEDYYAMIGTGQMVDFLETENICYDFTMQLAQDESNTDLIQRLNSQGRPPYYGSNISLTMNNYLQPIYIHMETHPEIYKQNWSTFNTLFSPEYSIWDSVGFLRGLLVTFSNTYQTLYEIDLRTDANEIDIPVYIFHGTYDYNAPVELVNEYYNLLSSPDKDLVMFEHSGHNPWISENQRFCDEVSSHFTQHLE